MTGKENGKMTPREIQGLLDRLGWSPARLASEIDVTEFAVRKWLLGASRPSGPANILLRQIRDGRLPAVAK